MDILASVARYEDDLRAEMGREVLQEGLDEKRRKMAGKDPFPFLRATYWRWAETVLDVAPDLAHAPAVLAVGDIHLENFGTWRDADGRLVWGVNDYDEAAAMPYALDLLRLATSGLLAGGERGAAAIARDILAGYAAGLEAPGAAVLDRERRPLREAVMVPEEHRADFWKGMRQKREAFEARPKRQRPTIWPRYESALRAAMPPGAEPSRLWYRSAGLGSLGRPRWVAEAEWAGDWVIREAKGVIPSAWGRAHGGGHAIRCMEVATGRFRAPDPWYRVANGIAARRLSPNNRKIEADKLFAPGAKGLLGRDVLLGAPMLQAMGAEVAAIHLGSEGVRDAIRRHMKAQRSGWLGRLATAAAAMVEEEHRQFRRAR
ncbi:DUF2252 domain-containing protein [Roseomonas populi]|uniref:DUF2252 domain-containing protein n=1 Tax=Roseomonas populi TaxID=3121582 RepID=A0ABT1WYB0_9PROT|nr:DUF2252 domain-containing protein [Roseomonas pecuniae]MCR0980841.1 DUF2252 domain-containing protein [Roseomonas pecuniae]